MIPRNAQVYILMRRLCFCFSLLFFCLQSYQFFPFLSQLESSIIHNCQIKFLTLENSKWQKISIVKALTYFQTPSI